MLHLAHRRVLAAAVLIGSISGVVTSAVHAADPEPRQITPSNSGWKTSPDSTRVVYATSGWTYFLMSAPLAGGPELTLNESVAIPTSIDTQSLQISANNQWVAFAREPLGGYDNQLYSVPLLDGTPMLLNNPSQGDLQWFQITGDNTRVIYAVSQRLDSGRTLKAVYSAPIDGSSPAVLLTPALTADQRIAQVAVAPDGSRVVFLLATEEWDAERSTLYSVPSSGGTAVILDTGLLTGAFSQTYKIAPNSGRVAYLRRVEGATATELYQVPLAGGVAARLDSPATNWFPSFDWSPNSSYLVFTAQNTAGTSNNVYSVAVTAGAIAVPLAPPVNGYIETVKITPDSSRVIYDGPDALARSALFSAPIGGGERVKLSGKLAPRTWYGDDILPQVLVGGSSRYVVYFADQLDDNNGREQMYGVPVDGSTPAKQLGTMQTVVGWGLEEQAEIAPDGAQVIYPHPGTYVSDPYTLYTTPVVGGEETLLSGAVGLANSSGDVPIDTLSVTADSRNVVFWGGSGGLYVVALPEVTLPGRPVYLPSITRD